MRAVDRKQGIKECWPYHSYTQGCREKFSVGVQIPSSRSSMRGIAQLLRMLGFVIIMFCLKL